LSEDSEQKFGLAGNEQAAGYESMPVASPVDTPEPETMTDHELSHFNRPAPPEPEVREYRNTQTGEEIPANQTVSAEQAAHDVGLAREQERVAREQRDADDLRFALDQLPQEGQQQPQQSPEAPQPEQLPQPDGTQMTAEEAQRLYTEADRELETALQNPLLREKLEAEFNGVRQSAAAEVERANALAVTFQNHYQQATNNLVAEASGVIGALYPELQGLSGEQLKGALQVMAQQNPQRVQQLQHLASRAQGLVEAHQRQQHEAQQSQALQREAALDRFTSDNIQEYEKWAAKENPASMKAVRDNLTSTVEKYGVPFQTLKAIHDGKMQMDATTFVRSAAFQKMLHDSIKYNLATRAVTEARHAAVPNIQRPGVTSAEPRDDGSYAVLERQLRGKDLTAKQGADLLIAHRGRR
jgi:hypothetical protein